jgi:hypothetical protein
MQVDRKVLEEAIAALEDACGGRCNAEYNPCWQQEVAQSLKAALEQPIIQSKIKVDSWHGLTDEERDYFKACGFVGVSRVEEVLRAKNSTLACIPAVPPGLEDIEGKKGL